MASRNTQQISNDEWEAHRQTITELYLKPDMTLTKLTTSMNERSFPASSAQLEARLNVWGVRKNLNVKEWTYILNKIDCLERSASWKVSISGVELSEDRIDRARRHVRKYEQREQTGPPTNYRRSRTKKGHRSARSQDCTIPAGVLIEILDPDGNWVSIEETDNPRPESALPPLESIGVSAIDDGPPGSAHDRSTSGAITQTAFADFDGPCASSVTAQHMLSQGSPSRQSCSQTRGYSPYRNSFDFSENIIETANNQFLMDYANTQSTSIRRLCSPDGLTQHSLVAVNPATPFILSNHYTHSQIGDDQICRTLDMALDGGYNFGLQMPVTEWPSQDQIQSPSYMLSILGESPSRSAPLGLAGHASLSQILLFNDFEQYLQLMGTNFTSLGSAVQGSFFNNIARGFFTKAKNLEQDSFSSRIMSLGRLLQNLDAWLPNNGAAVITQSQASETRFIRALLFSLLNGFVGLDDIPITEILELFGRLRIFSSSFFMLLKDGPRHASRTFLDTIFRACIEASDAKFVKELLELQLVDVNLTVIPYRASPYTPIERAAALQDLDLVKLLIHYGADVNKTYSVSNKGAMDQLWCDDLWVLWVHAPLVEIAKVLIDGGANMNPDHFDQAWAGPEVDLSEITQPQRQALWEVACSEALSLARYSSPSHHEVFFRFKKEGGSRLASIARYCSEEYTMQLIHNMIDLCRRDGCGSCLIKAGWVADKTVAGQTPDDLTTAGETAAVAMSQGKTKLVQLLIPYVSDPTVVFVAAIASKEAHLIELALSFHPNLAPSKPIHYRTEHGRHFTWPLVEAVKSGNKCLIKQLQAAGALHRLEAGSHFRRLVEQAACWGDLSYLRLLLCRADTSGCQIRLDVREALDSALENDNLEVVWLLLDYYELPVYSQHNRDTWGRLLCEALKLRNAPLVYAILNVNSELARPFLDVPFYLSPRLTHAEMARSKALNWGDTSIIRDIFTAKSLGSVSSESLCSLCKFCIAEDNPQLFRDILASIPYPGEDKLGDCLAVSVEKAHFTMSSYLLDQGANPFTPSVLVSTIPNSQLEMSQALVHEFASRRKAPKCIGASQLNSILGESLESIHALDYLLQIGVIDMIRLDSIDHRMFRSVTPLGLVVSSPLIGCDGYLSVVEKMLKAGSDPNAIAIISGYPASKVLTGFMIGIETGYEEVVELLIKHKAKVNTDLGPIITRTPLQYAAELGNVRMVRLLLRHNAIINANAATTGGGTALQFAAISGNCTIAKLLLDNGAELGALPSKIYGRWPLEAAAEHGRLDMIQLLWNESIERKTQLGFQRRQCLRAMKLAHDNGHIGCMNLIEELSGIPADRLDVEDYGAMWIAYSEFDKEELERIWSIGDGWANTDSIPSGSKSRRQLWYDELRSEKAEFGSEDESGSEEDE